MDIKEHDPQDMMKNYAHPEKLQQHVISNKNPY